MHKLLQSWRAYLFSKSPKLCKSNCKQGCFCFCSDNEGFAQGRESAGPDFPNQAQIEPKASSAPSVRKVCVESVVFRRNDRFLIRCCTTHTLFTNNENLYKRIKDPLIQYNSVPPSPCGNYLHFMGSDCIGHYCAIEMLSHEFTKGSNQSMGLCTAHQRSLNGKTPKKNTSLPWEFLLNSLTIAQESSSLAGLLHPVLKWQYNSILRFPMMLVKMSWLLIQCV